MTDVINFKIDDRDYFVTKSMHAAIIQLAEASEALTHLAFPDHPWKIPVYLLDCGLKRIAVIKEIRQLTGMSLKDSKYATDRVVAGENYLLGHFAYNEAEKIAASFREAGATVTAIPSPLEMLAQQAE